MRELNEADCKKRLLRMLVFIDEVCSDNGIDYCLAFGSLLGAVRHKGFIPWDDDIDIVMTRDNYNLFSQTIARYESNYKLLFVDNSDRYSLPLPKFIDEETVLHQLEQNETMTLGLYIDIFILDNVPDALISRYFFLEQLKIETKLWALVQYKKPDSIHSIKDCLKIILKFLLGFIDPRLCAIKLNRLAQKYNEKETKEVGTLVFGCEGNPTYPKSMFRDLAMIEFEGYMFKGPQRYNEYLRLMYGDYMTLPPLEKRISKHANEVYIKE